MLRILLPRIADDARFAEIAVRHSRIPAFTTEVVLLSAEVVRVSDSFTDELMHQLYESGVLVAHVVDGSNDLFERLERSSRFGTRVVRQDRGEDGIEHKG